MAVSYLKRGIRMIMGLEDTRAGGI